MKIFFTFILAWSFSSYGAGSKDFVKCHPEAGNMAAVDLAKDIQGVVGSTPLFCRNTAALTDTKEDQDFSQFVKEVSKNQSAKAYDFEVESTVMDTLRFVAMKKVLAKTNEKTRRQIYVNNSCMWHPINKLPEFLYEKVPQDGEVNPELVKEMLPICKAYDFPKLIPLLSKEDISEGMLILAELYPKSYEQISSHVCKLFEKNPDALLKGSDKSKTLLSLNEDQKKFSAWFVDIMNYTPAHSNWLLGNKFLVRANDKMQLQGRAKDNTAITFDQQMDIYAYTNHDYMAINVCLRTGNCEGDSNKLAQSIQKSLVELKKVSNDRELTLFRGAGVLPEFVKKTISDNLDKDTAFVLDKGFMSASGNPKVAVSIGGYGPDSKSLLFVVKAKSCMGIDLYAREKSEDEFLCPAGMKVKVYKTEMPNVYELREAYE